MMSSAVLQSRSIATSLGCLQVKVAGDGPAIVFWPSLLMDGDMFAGVAGHLQTEYQIVLVDPPGQGGSEPLKRRFQLSESAECIPSILDALAISRAHYVGNSWGAMIGGTFAARHPDRIGAAILMNGTAFPAGLRQKLEYFSLVSVLRLRGKVPRALYSRAIKAFLGPTAEREQPELADYIAGRLNRLDSASMANAIDSVVPRRPSQAALFAAIRTPVCIVAGEEDRTFPVAETRAMAEAIPGAEFVCMPGVAHLASLEQPLKVGSLIREFVGRHPL